MSSGLSSVLNISRWFAALLVLIHHVRHILMADLKDVENKSLLTKIFYFGTGLGHEAVMIFFVVSGLLVGALTLEKWRLAVAKGMVDYFIHRFSRIYIVFIPALIVGFFMDYIGAHNFDGAQLYSNSEQYHTLSLNTIIKNNLGIDVFLQNLAMLQSIVVGVLGSNGPLWSLAYEWWYYCMWALIVGIIYYRGLARWVYSALLCLLVVTLPLKVLLLMSVWLLGVAVFYYGRSNLPKPHPLFGCLIFLVALIVFRLLHNADSNGGVSPVYIDFFKDFGLGLAYSVALVSCFKLEKPVWLDWVHIKLASFSYSLYLVHFPMMLFIIAIVQEYLGVGFLLQPSVKSYTYFSLVVSVLYLYGFLFSLVTEKHTLKLVTFLRSVIFYEKR